MFPPRDDLTEDLVEIERTQIGHDIHDALLPLIFAAASGVSAAIDRLPEDADESKQRLQQTSQWLDDALQIGRRLLAGIYPPELTGTLWIRAAKQTIASVLDCSAVTIQWRIDGEVEHTTPQIAIAAYRIVIESLRNAIAHGAASEVLIDAKRNADTIVIKLRDNGCGFDPTTIPQDRFGIRAMTGRAKSVGGKLRIDAQPGGPTTVTFEVRTP